MRTSPASSVDRLRRLAGGAVWEVRYPFTSARRFLVGRGLWRLPRRIRRLPLTKEEFEKLRALYRDAGATCDFELISRVLPARERLGYCLGYLRARERGHGSHSAALHEAMGGTSTGRVLQSMAGGVAPDSLDLLEMLDGWQADRGKGMHARQGA